MAAPLRVAVVGVGALGSIHARLIAQMRETQLVGILDNDPLRGSEAAKKWSCPLLPDLDRVIEEAEAVIVATPTSHHHEVAARLLDQAIPCLVEKPLAPTVEEGQDLVRRARRSGVQLMVGHVERFNPVVIELLRRDVRPRFLEAQRVSPFSFRSTDIGVVLDMMIHDIDLILHLVRSKLSSVHAVGLGILGEHEDLANARLVFENGAVANVTASRMALKTERRLRLFARDFYASLDLKARKGRILTPSPDLKARLDRGEIKPGRLSPLQAMVRKLVKKEELKVASQSESLLLEDQEFVASVREGRDPLVTGEHGVAAMDAAAQVVASIKRNALDPDLQ